MPIYIGKYAGFCWGVQRAIEMVEQARIDYPKNPIYTLGPLVHNNDVVSRLKDQQILSITEDEIDTLHPGDVIVIRAHGISPDRYNALQERSVQIIDATCSYVGKAQRKAAEYTEQGYQVIIIGDHQHAEVIGLHGFTEGKGLIISNQKELHQLDKYKLKVSKLCIISQTTQNNQFFREVVSYIKKINPKTIVINTICGTTEKRQQELKTMAKKVNVMLILGSSHSANTMRLLEITKQILPQAYLVDSIQDLKTIRLQSVKLIGITAGASTPGWFIKEVVQYLEKTRQETCITFEAL